MSCVNWKFSLGSLKVGWLGKRSGVFPGIVPRGEIRNVSECRELMLHILRFTPAKPLAGLSVVIEVLNTS